MKKELCSSIFKGKAFVGSSQVLCLLLLVLLPPSLLQADSEIPVLVNKIADGKAMFLLDDSGSMAAVVEHENFSATSAVATNVNNKIPALIFRLESGSAAPTTS